MKNSIKVLIVLLSSFNFLFASSNILLLEPLPESRFLEYRDYNKNYEQRQNVNDLREEDRPSFDSELDSFRRYSDEARIDRFDRFEENRERTEEYRRRIDYTEHRQNEREIRDDEIIRRDERRSEERDERRSEERDERRSEERDERRSERERSRFEDLHRERLDREQLDCPERRQKRVKESEDEERIEERIRRLEEINDSRIRERRSHNDLMRNNLEQERNIHLDLVDGMERRSERMGRWTLEKLDSLKTSASMMDVFSNSVPLIVCFLVSYKLFRY